MKTGFILVADRSDALQGILKIELASTDHAVLHAKDGEEAIDYLNLLKGDVTLAIIALELPVVSGLDVIWNLVRQKPTRTTTIVATSTGEVPAFEDFLKEVGVHSVVRTPI